MQAIDVLADYADSFARTELPPRVIHAARRAVIDWYAAVVPGLAWPVVTQLEQALADDLDHGPARLVTGRAATPRTAALINGTAAHAAELDDSFRDAMYHPGAATIAAALAVGQQTGTDGRGFLRGIVLGYEISTRIGVVLGRPHYRYWHNTGTVGTFGAAAAAAGILGLDRAAFAHALATAATFAAGLQQAFRQDSMSKALHAGRAAEAGVLAALLAARGVTGSLDVLDGEAGLGRAMSDEADWSGIGATLGSVFNIERLTFKNHVGCGHAFAAIDGALALRRREALDPAAITAVRVATYQPALDIARHGVPATVNEARFSFPFLIASALVHGSVRLAAYTPERLADPLMRQVMARVSTRVDPEIDQAFPGRRSARVEIDTRDGGRFTHVQPDRKGDPELPLDDEELEGKFLELASSGLGESDASALLGRLRRLDRATALDW